MNHFVSSIYTIFYVLPPKIILRIFGSFLQCGYLTSVICALLLTLNRFDSIYHHKYFKFIDRDKFFKYGIFFCYLYGIVVLCIYNVPDFGYYFYLQTLSFQYDTDQDRWRYIWEYENKSAFVILTFCLFIYINIFLKVLFLRKQSLTESYKFSDIKLLIPPLFEILLTLSLETLWEYWLEPNSTSTYKFVILNYLFIIVSGTNTISSVLVIKEVQNTATYILKYKSKQSITRIISIAYAKKL
uniref:7TM_GPCR_Srx domain-containing protein n=1 Tax=Strongyloides papillosus TaxID=174720 RepID=A0A0N5BLN9_STREA